MEPLPTNKRFLQWLCMCTLDEKSNKWTKRAFALYIFACHLAAITTSGVFAWRFISTDLEGSLYALFQVSANMSVAYIIVIAVTMRNKVTATLKQLSEIYNQYKDEDSFQYLVDENNRAEWMWHIYLYVMGGFGVTTAVISTVTVSFRFLMNGSFNASEVYHPYKFSFPWDQSTFAGYVAEIAFAINVSEAFLITNGTLLLLFMSICLHHQAFYEMFHHSVRKLDQMDKDRIGAELARNLICFHIKAKDWFMESAKVYSPLIVVQLMCGVIFTACCVFELDLVLKHIDITICMLLFAFMNGLSTLFLYCFFGRFAADSFEKMSDSLYNANWHKLPVKLQKYFIIMIGNTQIPLYYHGFGIAILNLETFLKMLKSVFTYYMAFKTFTSD